MLYLCATNQAMEIQELQRIYARHPGVKALARELQEGSDKAIQVTGIQGSCASVVFASLLKIIQKPSASCFIFILDDEDEAGYFYHDLTRMLGEERVLSFSSSFKRAIKYGQRDAGQEILRTEVLSKLASPSSSPLFIVTHPQAISELVVTRQMLAEQTLGLGVGERVDIMFVQETLLSFGFHRTDYVYEPGQFAVRGSIIDVWSFSCDLPYRIDFFGDEVDSIRTFEVHSQLSRDRQENITLIGQFDNLPSDNSLRESFFSFLPKDAILVVKDLLSVCESVEHIYNEGFVESAITEGLEIRDERLERSALLVNPEEFKKQIVDFRRIELKALPQRGSGEGASIQFHTHPQPVFHKNFDLLISEFKKLQDEGTNIYILADSQKQTDRLEARI